MSAPESMSATPTNAIFSSDLREYIEVLDFDEIRISWPRYNGLAAPRPAATGMKLNVDAFQSASAFIVAATRTLRRCRESSRTAPATPHSRRASDAMLAHAAPRHE